MRNHITVTDMYRASLVDESCWVEKAIKNKDNEELYNLYVKRVEKQRWLQHYLKMIPMDLVLRDEAGYGKEYATAMKILNA